MANCRRTSCLISSSSSSSNRARRHRRISPGRTGSRRPRPRCTGAGRSQYHAACACGDGIARFARHPAHVRAHRHLGYRPDCENTSGTRRLACSGFSCAGKSALATTREEILALLSTGGIKHDSNLYRSTSDRRNTAGTTALRDVSFSIPAVGVWSVCSARTAQANRRSSNARWGF